MPITAAIIALCLAGLITAMSAGWAYAQTCDQLWYERNSIYRGAGYCFKTPRAIATFGNAGCMYDSEYALPLSPGQRARIASIARLERELGCR
jgi:YARHG domain